MSVALAVEGLTHRHRGARTPTFTDLTFQVPAGALAVIVGESGCGKTTLLRCLAGLDRCERGTIAIGERRIDAGGSRAAALALRGQVGLVFQSFELFPHLSVLENCVLAPVKVGRRDPREADATARALLTELGLDERVDAYPSMLSGGQSQRVAIARALAMRPECLLYDEPTSALDPSRRSEVVEILARIRSQGTTQVVVSHDAAVVTGAADVVFRIAAGRLERER